jgi:hypothetical protein
MWPTSGGDRTLTGTEAVLIANAIDTMLDLIIDYMGLDDQSDEETSAAALHTGISVYDSLRIGQRVAVLNLVAQHLLTPSIFHQDSITAAFDGAIAAIYSEIRDRVEIEIDIMSAHDPTELGSYPDLPSSSRWRRWVLQSCHETLGRGDWNKIHSDEDMAWVKLQVWEDWIDQLSMAILWDRDFEYAETFLDADPDAARARRRAMGIDEDYFVSPPPDPTPSQVETLLARTRNLVRSFCVGDSHPADDNSA